jgi:uncharacterized membrane protein YcaP (DUF421 family)
MNDPFIYGARSAIMVVVLLLGFRFFGKREMAQMTVYDLAMLMALANAVQNAMTGGRGELVNGLVTSSAVLLTAWAITKVIARRPALERAVIGSPTVLIHDGTVLKERLRRERVGEEELDSAVRAHGLEDPSQVRLAVLEVDGSISVVPFSSPAPSA